jgi:hypothetical protein
VEGAAISVSLGVDLNKIKFNSRDIFDGTVEYSKGYGKKYFTCGKLVLPFLSMVTICSMYGVMGLDIYRGQTMGLFRCRDSFLEK